MKLKPLFSALLAAVALTLTLATPATAGSETLQGTWGTTLQARDLDGDSVTDAFYDTDLNITWLRNANLNGYMTWANANAWANGYSIGGYDDWRLPTTAVTCIGYDCTEGEMGHLWYAELGNTAGSMTNEGDFQNLQSYYYWFGTEYALNSNVVALTFDTGHGSQNALNKGYELYALVVRPGDVLAATVPEPGTGLLAVAALAGLGFVRRRRAVVLEPAREQQ